MCSEHISKKSRYVLSIDVDYFPGSERGVEILLDILSEYSMKATFFLTGRFAEEYTDSAKEIFTKGHEIGCHGYSHGRDLEENFFSTSHETQKKTLEKGLNSIKSAIGFEPKVFRAPYLKASVVTLAVLEELGISIDSSVASKRFDFGFGVANNLKTLFAPHVSYFPSPQNIFMTGNSSVMEVPASALFFPLSLSFGRLAGENLLNKLRYMCEKVFDPVVFIAHPWEVLDHSELTLWPDTPPRHIISRGKKAEMILRKMLMEIDPSSIKSYKDIESEEKERRKKE